MLRFEGLTKTFGDRVITNDVSLNIPDGSKVALVGPNGAGKTTILNIVCGLDEADHGKIATTKGAVIGYLPQEPNPEPEDDVLAECIGGDESVYPLKKRLAALVIKMEEDHGEALLKEYEELESSYRTQGGYSLEATAKSILVGLGFHQEQIQASPLNLSGGWRMRLELAKIFLKRPDLLILDEPTNHLDLPSLVFVESWLKRFSGTLVFVSHDRSLLNRLAKKTLYLEGGRLTLYSGGFDDFLNQKAERQAQEASAQAKITARIAEHEKFVARFGAKATKAKQAQSRLKMIAKLRSLERDDSLADDSGEVVINLPTVEKSGREVVSVESLDIGYHPESVLCSNLSFLIERGSRVAVIGANGIGKSTLLKTIAEVIPSLSGSCRLGHKVSLAYFAQDQATVLDLDSSLIENVMSASTKVGQLAARKILGSFLFSGDSVFKVAKVLSGGEKNRLGMACLLVKEANFLLLDEPTNHLDMASVEVLVEALSRYEGTTMFVSHNREFIDALATHVLVMLPDGRARLFLGSLDDYQRLAAQTGFPNVLVAESTPEKRPDENIVAKPLGAESAEVAHAEVKRLRQQKRKAETKLGKCEKQQNVLEGEVSQLEADMACIGSSDFERLNELASELETKRNKLSEIEEFWLLLSEEIEECSTKLEAMGRL